MTFCRPSQSLTIRFRRFISPDELTKVMDSIGTLLFALKLSWIFLPSLYRCFLHSDTRWLSSFFPTHRREAHPRRDHSTHRKCRPRQGRQGVVRGVYPTQHRWCTSRTSRRRDVNFVRGRFDTSTSHQRHRLAGKCKGYTCTVDRRTDGQQECSGVAQAAPAQEGEEERLARTTLRRLNERCRR